MQLDTLVSAWPNLFIVVTLTQLRVTAFMFMHYLVGSGSWFSAWDPQTKVIYHVRFDDSYVLSMRWPSKLGYATFVNPHGAALQEWEPWLKQVDTWEKVPDWIRVRLSEGHSEAG